MSYETHLPFPRGGTAGGKLVDIGATTFDNLEGRIYTVPDTVHGKGGLVKLRVVRNAMTTDITVTKGQLYAFEAVAGKYGGQVSGVNTSAGGVCKPIDDAYAASFTIPVNDLFYVVEEGRCNILTSAVTTGVGLFTASNVGIALQSNAAGVLAITAATTADFIVARLDDGCATVSTLVRCNVVGGLGNVA